MIPATLFRQCLCAALLISGVFSSGIAAPDTAGTSGMNSSSVHSTLVNAAPNFSGVAESSKKLNLTSLRGKPVLLVIAPSPKDRSFRMQMQELSGIYERYSAQGGLAFAALTGEGGKIPSNIPFILVNDPASVAASYDVTKGFAIAVIGSDGNLDCLSTKPLPGQRVYDLVMNNAEMQRRFRR